MCDKCVATVNRIPPEVFNLLLKTQAKYKELEDMVREDIKQIHQMVITKDDDCTDAEEAEVIREMNLIAGSLGIAMLLGWNSMARMDTKEDAFNTVSPLLGSVQSALNMSLAYKCVQETNKH